MSDAGRNRFPETCGDCGSRFKVLKKRGPDEGSFGWNYCPHCGASLGPTYSSTSPREGQCPSCGTDGSGDDVLANDQLWCPDDDCGVVSFRRGGRDE